MTINVRLMAIGNGAVAGGTITTVDSVSARTMSNYFQIALTGSTAQRPTLGQPGINLTAGTPYYDTTVGDLIVWDGVTWRSPITGSTV